MNLSLSKLPWYAQVGAFLGLSLGAIVVFYFFYVSPTEAQATASRQRLETLRADVSKGFAVTRKLPQVRKQVDELEARLDELKAVLPEEKDMGELLRRIQTLAVQSNLTIRSFKPVQTPIRRQMHAEWPIQLELEGNFHNLAIFFDRIGKFSRLINISDVTIRAKDKPDPNTTITVACVATTFVLVTAPPQKTTPTAPAAPAGKSI